MNTPELNEGEIYAGILLGKDGEQDQHIFLLPLQADDAVTFKQAQEFAKATGGDLPTRREQALLFANLPEQFEKTWYWSGEEHAANSGCAWCQFFNYGGQHNYHKSNKLRARSVRRSKIYA